MNRRTVLLFIVHLSYFSPLTTDHRPPTPVLRSEREDRINHIDCRSDFDPVRDAGEAYQSTALPRMRGQDFRRRRRRQMPELPFFCRIGGMNRALRNWPKVVLILVPLAIFAIDAAALFAEWRQPASQKAVQLVRESKSRKENFTVQQYLYATVYHRQKQGESITIEGWRAEPVAAGADKQFSITFAYTDADGRHTPLWEANVGEKTVAPK